MTTSRKEKLAAKHRMTQKKAQHFEWKPIDADADAEIVHLAGDFDGWNPIPMTRGNNAFSTSVELYPGEYQYKFIVDGVWRDDPAATASVANGFGTMNSVIHV